MNSKYHLNRRQFLLRTGLLTAGALLPPRFAWAQAQKIRVGLMLPYTGTYAQLGVAITNGFKLAVNERGGKLAGRDLEYFTVDDESEPSKAPENTNKLVHRDRSTCWLEPCTAACKWAWSKLLKKPARC